MSKRDGIVLAVALGTIAAGPAVAQFKPSTIVAKPIRGGAYWLSGGVSNAGFVVGDKGVIVFDTQISTTDAKTAMAAIAAVTPKPIDAVIVSHGDPDHIGGLAAFPPGAQIIEQEGTVPYVAAGAVAAATGGPWGAIYAELVKHPPTRTIGITEALVIDGVQIVLMHVAPAHTDGDLIMYLPRQKVVFGADVLLTSQALPVIHAGGSSLGWIATMRAMLALDADTYVPGHGPIETKTQLQTRLRVVEERRDAIKTMVRQGRTLEEIEKALPEPYSPFHSFAAVVFKELTTGSPPEVAPWTNAIRPMTQH